MIVPPALNLTSHPLLGVLSVEHGHFNVVEILPSIQHESFAQLVQHVISMLCWLQHPTLEILTSTFRLSDVTHIEE